MANSESTPLVVNEQQKTPKQSKAGCILIFMFAVAAVAAVALFLSQKPTISEMRDDFVWGVATSSYQIEGGRRERGETIWDVFVAKSGTIMDGSNADVACDHYHRMEEDVQILAGLGVNAYRFSISWARILPAGKGLVNPDGVDFYNRLIDKLLAHDIVPYVTLFHWDTPQALEEEIGGWLSPDMPNLFRDYADLVFKTFGDRVQNWITVNEPWTVSVAGYNEGVHAPGHKNVTESYLVGHHMLLGHAKAALLYRQKYSAIQKGMIGIANCGDYRYPADPSVAKDHEAAERAMQFQFGWFVDPLIFGDYPAEMRRRLQHRLPSFMEDEKTLLLNAGTDFLGLNYYSSLLASAPEVDMIGDYWTDMNVRFSDSPAWRKNAMGWNIVPEGIYLMLKWISQRYDNIPVYITENGSAQSDRLLNGAVDDSSRLLYIKEHIRFSQEARYDGVNLRGYFAWSMMDNFEWQFGYQRRFGIYYVDYSTQDRTPKASAEFYKNFVSSKLGADRINQRALQTAKPVRQLAPTVFMAYASHNFDAVKTAIKDGCNVIVWAFVDFVLDETALEEIGVIKTTLDIPRLEKFINHLDSDGHDNVIHLISVGGWNGDHLDTRLTAEKWYSAFQDSIGHIFHGIDWDLEGNDDLLSQFNTFTPECLQLMGEISILAKSDGYWIAMAPPQSYLDIDSSRFSRRVNHTDEDRSWHCDFSYFGENVYSFLLQKYGPWIDLVSVQFYESYSRAAMAIYNEGISPQDYIESFVEKVASLHGWMVDFPIEGGTVPTFVAFPMNKLVLGFANDWANNGDDKTLYLSPEAIGKAWSNLQQRNLTAKGAMFWTIEEESSTGRRFAQDLGQALDLRVANPPVTNNTKTAC